MDKVRRMRGQSMAEFALCLLVLILILLGAFDLGRVFHAYIVITNAAREGAYYGAMHPTDTNGIVTRVLSEAEGSGIALSTANVSVSSSGISSTPMCVTVSYDFTLLTSFLLGGRTIRLQSCAEMVVY